MNKNLKRGDIWWIDWSPGRGSEQYGIRPALIIQTDAANSNPKYPNTIIVAISTKGKPVPFHIPVEPSSKNGLKELSYIKTEQLLTVSKKRLIKHIGELEGKYTKEAEKAIKSVLEL